MVTVKGLFNSVMVEEDYASARVFAEDNIAAFKASIALRVMSAKVRGEWLLELT